MCFDIMERPREKDTDIATVMKILKSITMNLRENAADIIYSKQ